MINALYSAITTDKEIDLEDRSALPMISTKASAVSGPTPGCVCKRRASGHFSTHYKRAPF